MIAVLRAALQPRGRLRSIARRALCLAAGLIALAGAAGAGAETLGSFYHTAFLKQDGAPRDVGGVAQTSDGFLWIAGTRGLTRFDGARFTPFRPLPGERFLHAQLDMLFPAEGSGLWIANSDGSATLLRNGHLVHYGPGQGYEGVLGRFVGDRQGHVWSFTTAGLLRFDGQAWHLVDRSTPDRKYMHAAFDDDGNLWLIISRRLFVLPRGGSAPVAVANGPDGAKRVFTGRSGHVYVSTPHDVHVYRRDGLALGELAQPIPVYAVNMAESKDGSVWLGSIESGLYYLSGEAILAAESARVPPAPQHMGQADGLSSDYAPMLMEDREGNMWLGTSNGLDRFRRAAFTRIKLPSNISQVNAAVDRSGRMWIGSETYPLFLGLPSGELKETEVPKLTLASYVDPADGSVWTGNAKGVWRLSADPPRLEKPLGRETAGQIGAIRCMARDRKGAFYLCVPESGLGHGLLVSDGDTWKEVFDHPVFPKTLAVDDRGDLWAGAGAADRLYRLSGTDGSETRYDERQNLDVGVVRAIYVRGGQLWVGGDKGIQYFDGRRFVTLLADNPEAMSPVAGLVLDRHGDLWAQTLDSVLRVRAEELRGFLGGTTKAVHPAVFDDGDGVPGAASLSWTLPSLRTSSDGRIWAQTDTGLAWVDPDRLPAKAERPLIYIDGLEGAHGGYAAAHGEIRLPPTEKAIRIGYTSPSLSRPERVTFRYRLVGFNDAWQDAGTRREAGFTNLAPGTYRFEVVAVDENGLQSASPAAIAFTRLPAYYETWWFRALWIIPIILIHGVVQEMRSRALTRRLKIRADEREAVARDIHDTLLQRLHGVLISLQRLANDDTIPRPPREAMAQLCQETRDAIVEGREQILALRRDQDYGLALYDALMAEGRRLQERCNIHFALEVHGTPRALQAGPQHELRDIALEAMRNAFVHAGASRVVATLNYEEHALWLVVSDNGKGFDKATAARARREGHFGLVGMRERVLRMKGTINIESSLEEGTEIHVRLPSRAIYAAAARPSSAGLNRDDGTDGTVG